eukprot:GEMP01012917.1.p1 GENE.GEMP01012917.1~~GEMP01012917.1.p1  ORF type:complete len:645 (+),score=154.37 GEMP01012917.1:73-2007(+)
MIPVPTTLGEVVTLIEDVIATSQLSSSYDIWSINMYDPTLWGTAAALFVAGVLASASGIGGGGIFVAVLMIVASLTPHQAVPLSKALIFSGAIMSFIVNSRKRDSRGQLLIQVELVKNIVPMALGGTLLGVVLNVYTPRSVLVLCLAALLILMTARLFKQAITTYKQENDVMAVGTIAEETKESRSGSGSGSATPTTTTGSTDGDRGERLYFEERNMVLSSPLAIYRDASIMVLLLAVVITCGALRHYLPADSYLPNAIMAGGISACIAVTFLFRQPCMDSCDGQPSDNAVSLAYPIMSFCAGICSGLMGIGGGLIFAPFLLMTGLEPTKAVCTSATCVIFTATSTTLQYLFLGRVMIYHALFLGAVTLTSSIVGTKFIHSVKTLTGRSSPLVFTVALAVGMSCALILYKGIRFAQEDWPKAHFHLSLGFWLAQIMAAFGWKLTTSMDDVMWLSPFLAQSRNKLTPTLMKLGLYICVVQTVVFVASSIVWGSEWLSKYLSQGGHNINIHGYLLLFSGSMLLCYSMFLLREWYQEKFGDGNDEEDEDQVVGGDLTMKRLLIVSFLGQLDELASFTTALLGGFFAPLALSIGCLFACCAIAAMCVGALKIRAIANCILGVPVWCIIGTLSVYNICNGLSGLIHGDA